MTPPGIRRPLSLAAAIAMTLGLAGTTQATNIGEEGCAPDYWADHTTAWQDYRPNRTLGSLFDFPPSLSGYADETLLDALRGVGGLEVSDGAERLLRASVAAYLNAAHEGVGYPYRRSGRPGPLSAWVNESLASGSEQSMVNLAEVLEASNSLGCPLPETESAVPKTRGSVRQSVAGSPSSLPDTALPSESE